MSVRKSPELRGRSLSPSREAVQNAAREAAEAAIHMAEAESRKSQTPPGGPVDRPSGSPRSTPEKNGMSSPPPAIPTSSAALQNLISSLAAGPSLLGLSQQPQLLAAFATLAAMSNNPTNPAVSMGGFPGAFPGITPPGGGSDPSSTLQTLAQLQTLFNPAAQMMSMQQVLNNFRLLLSYLSNYYLPT